MSFEPLNPQEVADLSVLIVDDNQNMRQLMHTMMMMLGIEHYNQVIGGQEALAEIKAMAKLPDVVFIDIKMAPMDGIELTRRIRLGGTPGELDDAETNTEKMSEQEQAISKLPIIIFSAHSQVERVMAARDAGANDFLAKPLSPRSVLEHITMVLRNPGTFVDAASYIGPDRRRQRGGYEGSDRRQGA